MATVADVRTQIQRAAAIVEVLAGREGTDTAVSEDGWGEILDSITEVADALQREQDDDAPTADRDVPPAGAFGPGAGAAAPSNQP